MMGFFSSIRANFLTGLILLVASSAVNAGVIFQDNFDNTPDWTSDQLLKSKWNAPQGWTAGRSDELWSPATGYPNKHPNAEILSSNADKAYGGKGKSFVAWRESYNPGWNKFNSDSVILKHFSQGYDAIYVEFYVTFSNNMIKSYYANGLGQSKLFRVFSFNDSMSDVSNLFSYFTEDNKPEFLWDIAGDTTYGVRNFLAFRMRGDDDIRSYIDPQLPSGAQMMGSGDMSLWYGPSASQGMGIGGTTPHFIDYKNGGNITSHPNNMDQVFGGPSDWVKMAFYVKMNSAPGVADGKMMEWMNGQRILNLDNIPWVRTGQNMVSWNTVGISGNDFFRLYPNSDEHEEWYAIDNVVVRDDLPPSLREGMASPPNAPKNLKVN